MAYSFSNGSSVTATGTELSYLDITTLGTSQASKAVTVDANGDLIVPDSDKFKFGAGSDMQLYHDGNNSYITNATGALKIATETSGIAITIGHTTSEVTVADNFTVTGTSDLNSTLNVSGTVSLDGSANELRFYEGSNYVGFEAPSLSANQIWVLPTADGADGQQLTTDGNGTLSWAAAGAAGGDGTMKSIKLNNSSVGDADIVTLDFSSNFTATESPNTEIQIGIAAAQTTITSILATDLKLGEDDQTKIDFETANEIHFYANNVSLISLTNANSGDAVLTVPTQDKNFTLKGDDGGSAITALDIDMADAGRAVFNNDVRVGVDLEVLGALYVGAGANEFSITESSDDITLKSLISDKDLKISGNDGGSNVDALSFDMSDAGRATFNNDVRVGVDLEVLGALYVGAGANEFSITESSDDITLKSLISDKDLSIKGNDGGSEITALTFDMSAAGKATFNNEIVSGAVITSGAGLVIADAGNIGSASDTDAIAIAANGVVTFSQSPVFPDGSIAVADLDIDGATDIGAALADADLFIVDDGAGGTNRKATLSRLKTYIGAGAADDLTAGDAAVTVSTTSGNITVDSNAGSVTVDGHTGVTLQSTNSGNIVLDSVADIELNADGADVTFKDGSATTLTVTNSSNDAVLTVGTQDKDFIIKGDDGGSAITALTLDMSDAGRAVFNNDVRVGVDLEVLGALYVGAGANEFSITESSDDITLKSLISDKDLKISGNDGGSNVDALSFDMSAAGKATFNNEIVSGAVITSGAGLVIADGGNIGSASDTDAIAIASNGVVTFSQNPVFPDGGIAVADLDIDGATDIGAALADADLIIVDDGAGGTNRKATLSRLKTYIGAGAADDLTAGDAAVTVSTSSGDITVDSNAGAVTIDGHTGVTLQSTNSGNIVLDSVADIELNADGADVTFKDGSATTLTVTNSSNDAVLTVGTQDKDFIVKGDDGGSAITALTLDMSDAGRAVFNNDVRVGVDLEVLGALYVGAGANEFSITESSDDITLKSLISDKDLKISGNDGGSNVDALSFDMSDAGRAVFNNDVRVGVDLEVLGALYVGAGANEFSITESSDDITLKSLISDKDLSIKGNDGGSEITALTFDMSAAGKATFNDQIVSGAVITSGAGLIIADAGNIGSASDTDAIAIASNGVVTFSQSPVFPDGSIAVADLDIDGATDIGAALADADLFIVDDGAGGTNRKSTLSRLKTYIGAGAADDLTAGDAAVTVSTTSGNVTIDSNAGSVTVDGHTGVTLQSTNSGNIVLDSVADIELNADGADVTFKDGSATTLTVTNSSNDAVLTVGTQDKDFIVKGDDGGSAITALTLDMSAAGAATFNSTVTATGFTIGSAAITETELEILDGATVTTTELNLLDGGTSVGSSITLADADGVVVNDGGAMKTIPVSDVKTYVGTTRYTESERYKVNAMASTSNVYFVGDVASDAGQFATALSATNGSTIAVDGDWVSGFEAGGLGWQAPRNVTLTKICATAKVNGNSGTTGIQVNVFKGTPPNDQTFGTDITITRIGTAIMSVDGDESVDGGDVTDNYVYTINKTISSSNSVSAGDVVIMGFSPVGAASGSTTYALVTLEYTVA